MVPDDIKANLDVAFEFGKVANGDSRSVWTRGLRAIARKNMPLKGVQAMQPGYINRIEAYYKANPRRSGNPYNMNWGDPKETLHLPKFMRSDYEIAVQGKMPLGFDMPDLNWKWLKSLNAWRREHLSTHGPKYAETTQDMATVKHANGNVTTKPVKKGNILIDVDNVPVEATKVNTEGLAKTQNPNKLTEIVKSEEWHTYYGKTKNGQWKRLTIDYDKNGKIIYKLDPTLFSASANKHGGKLDRLKGFANRYE